MIRMHCSDITVIGRITSGVKLMNVGSGAFVASVAKLARTEEDENVDEDGEEFENSDTADVDIQNEDAVETNADPANDEPENVEDTDSEDTE